MSVSSASRLRRIAVRVALLLVVPTSVALTPSAASAATFTPASVPDLIADINTANTNGESDVIDLGGGTFTLTLPAATGTGLPVITGDSGNAVTIRNGTIQRSSAGGTPAFRILAISAGDVTLENLSIANGDAPTSGSGGGVANDGGGALTLTDSRVEGNTAGGDGGGVYSNGPLTMTGTAVSANSAASDGGGVFAVGTVSVTGSAVDNNTATAGGGGIYGQGSVQIIGSALSANNADAGAGVFADTGTLELVNSTVSGNGASNSGGGLRLDASSANIRNSTIVENAAPNAGANIFTDGLPGLENIDSTIIASPAGGGSSCNSGPLAGSFNLDGDGSCGLVNGANNNQVGTTATPLDPLLGPLANNGGATETHALLGGSPAIDTGDNPLALAFDQRGTGFPRVVGSHADIGAFELIEDADSDGIEDGTDNCPAAANADQADTDGDDIGDVCDPCTDVDADGVGDPGFDTSACPSPSVQDNCAAVANPDQVDQDADGLGDACDPCPSDATNTCNTPVDSDSDGLTDAKEASIGTNPNDPDTDDDGLKDGREWSAKSTYTCLNLFRKDSDGEGIGDFTELNGVTINQYYTTNGGRPGTKYLIGKVRTNPCKQDTEGDGLTDWREAVGSAINQRVVRYAKHGGAYLLTTRKTHPLKRDTDGDALSDKAEITGSANWRFDRRRSDPTAADTDWGGNKDGREVFYHRSDPTRVGM